MDLCPIEGFEGGFLPAFLSLYSTSPGDRGRGEGLYG